jgi:hypothetical protein
MLATVTLPVTGVISGRFDPEIKWRSSQNDRDLNHGDTPGIPIPRPRQTRR